MAQRKRAAILGHSSHFCHTLYFNTKQCTRNRTAEESSEKTSIVNQLGKNRSANGDGRDRENAIGRIPILVSNFGVPYAFQAAATQRAQRDAALRKNASRVRVCDATAVKLHGAALVVGNVRKDATYFLLSQILSQSTTVQYRHPYVFRKEGDSHPRCNEPLDCSLVFVGFGLISRND